jgi:ABC-type methionine transport system permease subunit
MKKLRLTFYVYATLSFTLRTEDNLRMTEKNVPEKAAVLGASKFKLVFKYYLGDNTKGCGIIPTSSRGQAMKIT